VKHARVRHAYLIFLATLHSMIVESLSMPAAFKEKLKPILAPKG
jgi:hypothetical protein